VNDYVNDGVQRRGEHPVSSTKVFGRGLGEPVLLKKGSPRMRREEVEDDDEDDDEDERNDGVGRVSSIQYQGCGSARQAATPRGTMRSTRRRARVAMRASGPSNQART